MPKTGSTSRSVVLPLIGPVVVVGLFLFLSAMLASDPPVSAAEAERERWKVFWGLSALFLVCACLWNIALSFGIVLRSWQRDHIAAHRWLVAVAAVVNLAGIWFTLHARVSGGLGRQLLQLIETNTGAHLYLLTRAGNLLAIFTVTSMILAATFLSADRPDMGIEELSKRAFLFIVALYSAAALLVIGVIEVGVLFRWAAAVHVEGGAISPISTAAIRTTANTLSIAAGLLFTLLLIVVYGPVAVIQHLQLDKLRKEEMQRSAGEDISGWLDMHGLRVSPLAIGGAMFSPLLGALVANMKDALEGVASLVS